MKIENANKQGIDCSSDLPDLSTGVQFYFQNVKIDVVRKTNDGGYILEKKKCFLTQGVRQTMTPAQLAMKPEGERTWKWSRLHLLPDPKLELDWIVVIREVKYRVMAVENQAEYGYIAYDLLEDYENES